jgi:hypothetical protein
MKKLFYFVLGIIVIMTITPAKAQKVLVTDDASFSAPSTLLQVHKTGTGGDVLQATTGNTGTTGTDGFKVTIPSDNTVDLNNQENTAMKFFTNGTSRMTIDAAGNVQMTGLLSYNFIHGACYIENASYTPAVSFNVYTKITPGMTVSEADGLTISSDQVTIATAGDYKVDLVITMSGSDGNDYRVKMYKNGSATGIPGSNRISTSGSSNYVVLPYFWYVSLAASDVLSFYITNTSNSDDPTISDMKVYLEKKPE